MRSTESVKLSFHSFMRLKFFFVLFRDRGFDHLSYGFVLEMVFLRLRVFTHSTDHGYVTRHEIRRHTYKSVKASNLIIKESTAILVISAC